MIIREAKQEDNLELQILQEKCPMGTSFQITTINTPDFFARVNAYKSHKTYIACLDDEIIGSGATTIKEVNINGKLMPVGYEFQYFSSPEHRRKGVAQKIHNQIQSYLVENEVALSYLIIMEENEASIRFFEKQGFNLHGTLLMPVIWVCKEIKISTSEKIRKITTNDYDAVVCLINETWKEYNLFEPITTENFAEFIERTPEYSQNNLYVKEDQGEISACIGYWDWSQITKITITSMNFKNKLMSKMINFMGHFMSLPRAPSEGSSLKQWCLAPIGFKNTEDMIPLFKQVNNLAYQAKIDQLFWICEKNHPLLNSTKGLMRNDIEAHLYVKPLRKIELDDSPIFFNGVDL
ncbi:MAG: GNAT family N-acetyltransferase [Candidatus Kariarchaeaceae archaeon]